MTDQDKERLSGNWPCWITIYPGTPIGYKHEENPSEVLAAIRRICEATKSGEIPRKLPNLPCMECPSCEQGHFERCEKLKGD